MKKYSKAQITDICGESYLQEISISDSGADALVIFTGDMLDRKKQHTPTVNDWQHVLANMKRILCRHLGYTKHLCLSSMVTPLSHKKPIRDQPCSCSMEIKDRNFECSQI